MPTDPSSRPLPRRQSVVHRLRARARARWLPAVAAGALAALPAGAGAQEYVLDRTVSVSGGAARFELAGTGTTPIVAVRADAELTRWLVAEIGVGGMRPKEDAGRRLTYFTPELQLQLQVRAGALRPYLGAGGAYWAAVGPNRRGVSSGSASAAAGVRLLFPDPRFAMRGEVRLRGIGRDLDLRTTEYTGGIALRF